MEIRPIKDVEIKYTYTQSTQIQGQTGCIGHLRGDFDSSGQGFYTSWDDHWLQYKTEEFKRELDEVINTLRSDRYGLLKDRPSMVIYADKYQDSAFEGNYCTEYGFRADTDTHAYLIRCNPVKGDYNFYCYCYVSEWLDKHIENAKRGIGFEGIDGKEQFRIPDGEKIEITYENGEKIDYTCRYINETHFELGRNLYHKNQFTERMADIKASYQPKEPGAQNMAAMVKPRKIPKKGR